ncbi:unnamed protein product [Cladocopium goreaui]|uniref:Peptidylprolyl isomerase n=1 Tax=Cladocopium goreaui TaxID=2562237 RepID=A0A9P1DTR3_9DINO|nr:unnamed protein product [Cladocopium goreaui]
MSCWRGVCRVCRGRGLESPETEIPQHGLVQSSRVKTFDAAPPSASYNLMDAIERQEAAEVVSRRPQGSDLQDLKEDMEKFRKSMEKAQKETEEANRPKSGPREAPGRFDFVTVEDGSGHRKPQMAGTVKVRYAVVLERDASLLEAKSDFVYVLGAQSQGVGEVCSQLLDGMLLQMRRGQVASVTHPLRDLFASDAPVIAQHGPEEVAVCEVSLLEIFVSKDCSFKNSTGQVLKEVIKDGAGSWCNNPSDEGLAVLRVEKISTAEGRCLFPEPGASPMEMFVNVGDGEVCDALECAVLEMRPHETALVTCTDPSFLVGAPLGEKPVPKSSEYTLRVTLLDFNPGPDAPSFDEEDRLTFALRRKAEANRLFKEGRFRLSRQRYEEICDLFHHLDIPKVKDRFLGKYELWQECRKLRLDCRLNIAACCIKLQDSSTAKEACDLVLKQMPENTKASYRRAQAQMQQRDFVEACKDLRRLLDIDPTIQEARRLWEKAVKQRKDVDQQQKKALKYDAMCRKILDDRSDKFTLDNAPTFHDDPEYHQGRPVCESMKLGKEQLEG